MVFIVVCLFNSIRTTLLIWLIMPLAIIGVTAGLLLTGMPFGFMALLGVLSLGGELIKKQIVVLSKILTEIDKGKPPYQAILDGGTSKMRPVCMVVITTVLGMIPLLKDPFFGAMAVCIMFGLSFAAVLSLIVTPVLYAIFFGIHRSQPNCLRAPRRFHPQPKVPILSDITILFTILAIVIVLFVTEKIPVVLVALGTALALYLTGILNLGQALGGLGDTSTIFIASLFVVSAGLEITGVTAWAGQLLIAKSGESRVRQLVLIMLLCSALTGLISLNGAVAALLPVVVVMAVRLKRSPSQLLMPMVFSAHAGSILALTGSPVNVLVSEAAKDAGTGNFGFFEFSIVGVPLLAGTIVILVLLGKHLLPNNAGESMPQDLSKHARTLVEQYCLADGVFQMRLRATSPLIGLMPGTIELDAYPGLSLIGLHAGKTGRPLTVAALSEGDTHAGSGRCRRCRLTCH